MLLADLISESLIGRQIKLELGFHEVKQRLRNHFYGKTMMFSRVLLNGSKVSDFIYKLEKKYGNYELTFEGTWNEVSMWEIPALSIVSRPL